MFIRGEELSGLFRCPLPKGRYVRFFPATTAKNQARRGDSFPFLRELAAGILVDRTDPSARARSEARSDFKERTSVGPRIEGNAFSGGKLQGEEKEGKTK